MKEYIVDLSGVMDLDDLHQRFQNALALPQWYGGNLDALYDVLTEMPVPAQIRILSQKDLPGELQDYFARLQTVLRDAEAETPGLSVRFEETDETEEAAEADPQQGAAGGRTVIITDLHGCYDECIQLLEKMDFQEDKDLLINLGDTIDRGPKIYETFEYLRGLKERMGERCVLIRGNHEQMMLDAAAHGGRDKDLWYYNSGEKTVFAFLHHKHRFQEYLSWYEEMPFYYTTEKYNCVHASLEDPDPAQNTLETLIWGRKTDYTGKIVMTGHTPYKVPIYFQGDHYGKIQEDAWTWLPETGMIALDTGCVYGNRLTGMIIKEDGTFLVTSVPSGVSK
ncbi:MAG: metallophosphoesterase [Eubacteriales bacterium]|nr:metallophosphoesterase [Eubacteriales bacterium]